jgi:hypothetical protein
LIADLVADQKSIRKRKTINLIEGERRKNVPDEDIAEKNARKSFE